MATAFPKDALRNLIATIAGYPVANVRWATEPVPFLAPVGGVITGLITLNVLTRDALGWDESRFSYDAGTKVQTEEIGGQRVATVSIRAESYNPADDATDVLERVRIGLNLLSSLAALKAAELSYLDIAPIVGIPNFSVDNREVSAASLDLTLGHVVYITPGSADQPGWIEKVTHKTPPVDPAPLPNVDLSDAGTFEH